MPGEDIAELVCSSLPVEFSFAVPVSARAANSLIVELNSWALIRLNAPGAVSDRGRTITQKLVHMLRTQILPLVVTQRRQ